MVLKKSKDQLVARLRKENFFFAEFSMIHEGDYSVADADWNYKDIPHLHYVHQLAEAAPSYADDDKIASIVVQKIPGLTIPLSVFIYENSPTSQLYYTASFFYVLIIESKYQELGPNRTRVTTTYCIGASKILRWTFPILRWLIKRNYRDLMSTDIPMRERRGKLRSWGYHFYNDTPTYSYVKSNDISGEHVILPTTLPTPANTVLRLSEVLPHAGEYLWGRDDAWGLRLVRSEDQTLRIYARMCHHQGASLDGQACINHRVQCPWHGRLFPAIATFDLTQQTAQTNTAKCHHFVLEDNVLTIALHLKRSGNSDTVCDLEKEVEIVE
jgi:nitrite reductase/ring-hydroxylating ferredoxin subunit